MALNPKTRIEHFIAGREGELPIGSRDPETRIEFFLAGREDELPAGHQEPESRLEHFIKDYRSGGDVTVIPLTVTENGDYTAPEGKAYSPVAVSVALPEDAYIKKSIPSTPTAIANFTDGAEMVMPSLTVGVDAVQDLHGYDSPWVGGAGTNLMPALTAGTYTSNGITAVVNGNGLITITGTKTVSTGLTISIPLEQTFDIKAGQYVHYRNSLVNSNIAIRIGTFERSMAPVNRITEVTSDINEVTTCAIYITNTVTEELNFTFQISVEAGSTATSWTPYSNICPIIGWDEVNVTVADDVDNPTVSNVYTIDLNGTRYGGRLEVVNGVARFVTTKGYIASYNGETLPSDWISDRDVYSEGATPTIGAEVVYTLATPTIIPLGNYPISSLEGDNNLIADSGEILDGEYLGGV